jgi:hypothetical protein
MRAKLRSLTLCLMAAAALTACQPKSGYERMVERELASGERYDSLFLGLSLGMTSKAFFGACWEMNKQGLVRQGSNNTSVAYAMGDQLPYSAMMDFYPEFHEDKIVEMPVMVRYDAWSPWNRRLWSDSLQVDLVGLLEEWHGPGFLRVEHPERGALYVKMDGNRRIAVALMDDQYVKVQYTDMSVDRPELPSGRETTSRVD